jgi:hypothetical protein
MQRARCTSIDEIESLIDVWMCKKRWNREVVFVKGCLDFQTNGVFGFQFGNANFSL